MALSARIFDLDGTLVDTNAAHVLAWLNALKAHHYDVSPDRIAVEIGKGGDKLIPSILGQTIEQEDGDALRKAHNAEYAKIAESTQLAPFPGVEVLFKELKQRGLKLALATSSKKDHLQTTWQSAKVDWSAYFDVIATAEDASEGKPAPGIVNAAIKKLNMAPTQVAMVGDTPFDAEAARDAGVVCLGVTCGGMNDAKTLRASGMRGTYKDPAELLAHLNAALQIASPSPIVLTKRLIEVLMEHALTVARQGLEEGEVPIGCVIARGNATVIASGHNELNASQNKIAHAEIVTFNRAAGKVSTDAHDLILVSTLEPCVMCLGASMEAAVDTILFGLAAPSDGGRTRVRPPVSPESQMPRILGNILAQESRALLEEFMRRGPSNPMQAKFVGELLRKE